jgi:hypothetical protein
VHNHLGTDPIESSGDALDCLSAGVEVASNPPSDDCTKPRYRVRRRSEAEKRYGITGLSAERVQSSCKSQRYIQSAIA